MFFMTETAQQSDLYALFGLIIFAVLLLFSVFFYFLPVIIGQHRGMVSLRGLFFVNLLLGWTVLGWIFCLFWSFFGRRKDDVSKTG